jgi:hypothetical protein
VAIDSKRNTPLLAGLPSPPSETALSQMQDFPVDAPDTKRHRAPEPEHHPLTGRERRDHVNGLFGAALRATRGLAVDRDHIRREARQRRHPGHEAGLELRGVESRQNIAEVIVGRRSVAKRPEPAL